MLFYWKVLFPSYKNNRDPCPKAKQIFLNGVQEVKDKNLIFPYIGHSIRTWWSRINSSVGGEVGYHGTERTALLLGSGSQPGQQPARVDQGRDQYFTFLDVTQFLSID